ncbi:MAG: DUF4474 domain-containing protein [Oscillospiraceae bacterium]|jgi:hypothetical protein|nr:DUF4474 domain-containing protein [Oscillospiraceae bacterium]
MQEKQSALLRGALSLLLVCAMLVSFASVVAAEQRSISNPDGAFGLPPVAETWSFFHPDTYKAGEEILKIVLDQAFVTGKANSDRIIELLNLTPLILYDEELPERVVNPKEGATAWLEYFVEQGLGQVYVCLRPAPDFREIPGTAYEFVIVIAQNDGKQRSIPVQHYYYPETGIVYSHSGLAQTGFNLDLKNFIVLTGADGFQRDLGYNLLYDFLAPLIFTYINTIRFPFEYDGKEWMLQIWKGNYWRSNGGEIGLYHRALDENFQWDCSDKQLPMSLAISEGERQIFALPSVMHWWRSGFYFTTKRIPAAKLTMDATIQFDDQAMLNALLISIEENKPDTFTYGTDGLTLTFCWKNTR